MLLNCPLKEPVGLGAMRSITIFIQSLRLGRLQCLRPTSFLPLGGKGEGRFLFLMSVLQETGVLKSLFFGWLCCFVLVEVKRQEEEWKKKRKMKQLRTLGQLTAVT